VRDLWLKTGRGKVVYLASDDLFPGKPQQLARACAGFSGIAIVVGDQERRGGVINNRQEEQLQFSRPVLDKPIGA
jgi:hypothetical protein